VKPNATEMSSSTRMIDGPAAVTSTFKVDRRAEQHQARLDEELGMMLPGEAQNNL
jgi:hypothetical protein